MRSNEEIAADLERLESMSGLPEINALLNEAVAALRSKPTSEQANAIAERLRKTPVFEVTNGLLLDTAEFILSQAKRIEELEQMVNRTEVGPGIRTQNPAMPTVTQHTNQWEVGQE